jgi:3-hydroxyisobutyrate dehydrogenase-like beta-hydroxyacid dehydrogenase
MAAELGVSTPMLDRAVSLFDKARADGKGDHDVAAMVEVISALPPKT